MSTKHDIIRLRRGTAAEWAASDPQPDGQVLKLGEPGYEKDTGKLKIGDGVSGWNNLPYFAGGLNDIPENVQDIIGLNINTGGFLVAGTGIGIVYDDDNNTLTISSSGLNPFDQDLNTTDSVQFSYIGLSGGPEGSLAFSDPMTGIIFGDSTFQNTAGVISTNPDSLSSFVKINNIVSCSQADYDSLSPPDSNTFYIITE